MRLIKRGSSSKRRSSSEVMPGQLQLQKSPTPPPSRPVHHCRRYQTTYPSSQKQIQGESSIIHPHDRLHQNIYFIDERECLATYSGQQYGHRQQQREYDSIGSLPKGTTSNLIRRGGLLMNNSIDGHSPQHYHDHKHNRNHHHRRHLGYGRQPIAQPLPPRPRYPYMENQCDEYNYYPNDVGKYDDVGPYSNCYSYDDEEEDDDESQDIFLVQPQDQMTHWTTNSINRRHPRRRQSPHLPSGLTMNLVPQYRNEIQSIRREVVPRLDHYHQKQHLQQQQHFGRQYIDPLALSPHNGRPQRFMVNQPYYEHELSMHYSYDDNSIIEKQYDDTNDQYHDDYNNCAANECIRHERLVDSNNNTSQTGKVVNEERLNGTQVKSRDQTGLLSVESSMIHVPKELLDDDDADLRSIRRRFLQSESDGGSIIEEIEKTEPQVLDPPGIVSSGLCPSPVTPKERVDPNERFDSPKVKSSKFGLKMIPSASGQSFADESEAEGTARSHHSTKRTCDGSNTLAHESGFSKRRTLVDLSQIQELQLKSSKKEMDSSGGNRQRASQRMDGVLERPTPKEYSKLLRGKCTVGRKKAKDTRIVLWPSKSEDYEERGADYNCKKKVVDFGGEYPQPTRGGDRVPEVVAHAGIDMQVSRVVSDISSSKFSNDSSSLSNLNLYGLQRCLLDPVPARGADKNKGAGVFDELLDTFNSAVLSAMS